MRPFRLLGALLLLVLLGLGLVFISTFFTQEGPSRTASTKQATETPGGGMAMPSNVKRISVSPSGGLTASFFNDKLIYINSTVSDGDEAKYREILLYVFDLRSERVVSSVVIDKYQADSPEALPCGEFKPGGTKGKYEPRYMLLGYDGRYIYYERDCVVPGKGVLEPLVYMVDEDTSTVIPSNISSRGVVAVGDGVVYKYLPDEGLVEALDVASNKTLWKHEYKPSYIFPQPQGPGRAFIGSIKGAWSSDGSLVMLLHDSDDSTGELIWVYGLVVASREGVEEFFFEAFRFKVYGALTYDIRVGFDGERVYVLTGVNSYRVEGDFVTLHSISLDGEVKELLSRSIRLERGSLGLNMLVREDRVAVVYLVDDNKLVTMTRGNTTWIQEAPIQVVEVLDKEGNVILNSELAGSYSLLGFKDDKVYLASGRYIYALSPDTGLSQIADLGPQGNIGAVVVLPILIPLLPFMEKPQTLATTIDGTIYIYREGYLTIIKERA